MEAEKREEFSMLMPISKNNASYCNALKKFANHAPQSSQRVYNVVSAYDGIDVRFLESLPDGTDIRTALRKSAGELHFDRCGRLPQGARCPDEINPYIENVGVDGDKVIPWQPATFLHWVPTLILEGKGDPVTAGDQAKDIFTEALRGSRILIRFPGIGHDMNLPDLETRPSIESKGPCTIALVGDGKFFHRTVRDCLIDEFLKREIDDFKNAPILIAIKPKVEVLRAYEEAKKAANPNNM
jgi:hypothetical protein